MALWRNILNVFVLVCLVLCCIQIYRVIRRNYLEERVTTDNISRPPIQTRTLPDQARHTAGLIEEDNEEPRDMVRLKVLQLMFPGQVYAANKSDGKVVQGEDDGDVETLIRGTSLDADKSINDVQASQYDSKHPLSSCSICLEGFEHGSLVVSKCHCYHQKCILEWMERKGECPYCRRSLWDPEAYNLLYRELDTTTIGKNVRAAETTADSVDSS